MFSYKLHPFEPHLKIWGPYDEQSQSNMKQSSGTTGRSAYLFLPPNTSKPNESVLYHLTYDNVTVHEDQSPGPCAGRLKRNATIESEIKINGCLSLWIHYILRRVHLQQSLGRTNVSILSRALYIAFQAQRGLCIMRDSEFVTNKQHEINLRPPGSHTGACINSHSAKPFSNLSSCNTYCSLRPSKYLPSFASSFFRKAEARRAAKKGRAICPNDVKA